MIEISRLKKDEFKYFEGKKVLIYGDRYAFEIYKSFKFMDIKDIVVIGGNRRSRFKAKIKGIKTGTPHNMGIYFQEGNDVIVQPTGFSAEHIQNIEYKIGLLGNVAFSPYSASEILYSCFPYVLLESYKKFGFIKINYDIWKWKRGYKRNVAAKVQNLEKSDNSILICSPTKTADHTLNYTFERLNESAKANNSSDAINYYNIFHRPKVISCIKERNIATIKIITGIREPIAQNLSMYYQAISDNIFNEKFISGSLIGKTKKEQKAVVQKLDNIIGNENELQNLWECYIQRYAYSECNVEHDAVDVQCFIQRFIPEYQKNVLDILSYSFDKEKGYTIIKEGNIEIFVYQLEKLNDIVPELSKWVGVSFDKLENGNQASDKWIGSSYKQALKKIEISQEYFDRCYDEPYVKHFYSEADIEKFKVRWRRHIQK